MTFVKISLSFVGPKTVVSTDFHCFPDVHRVLRRRRPGLDHRGPEQGADGATDSICLPANVPRPRLPAPERRHPPGPQGNHI